MKTLVILGRDALLLRTRQWLLEHEGYTALTIVDPRELRHIAAQVELLILCHTATLEDCNLAIAIASERWPCMSRLVLVASDDEIARAINAESCSIFEGPAKLLQVIDRLAQFGQSEQVPSAVGKGHSGTVG